jgi:DNA-binding transcriptional regulator YdaS (Cro superfamily)
MEHIIDTAARAVGNMSSLAAKLGVTKAAVWQWKKDGRKVPLEHCVSIERATKGTVTRRELRPDDWQDIWPELVECDEKQPQVLTQKEPVAIKKEAHGVAHA